MKEIVSTIPTSVERVDAQGFVVQADGKIAILHQLVERQHRIVWLGQSNSVIWKVTLPDTHLHNSF